MIQIIGRCARNEHGRVILYADEITDSMMNAVSETNRRREIQRRFNQEHGIVPKTIKKAVRDVFDIVAQSASSSSDRKGSASSSAGRAGTSSKGDTIDPVRLINEGVTGGSEEDKNRMIDKLSHEMEVAAKALDFEKAAEIRDIIIELKGIKS